MAVLPNPVWYHAGMTRSNIHLYWQSRIGWIPFAHVVRVIGIVLLLWLMFQTALPGYAHIPAQTVPGNGPVYAVAIESTLNQATISFVRRSLQVAEAARANALIITLSTGGGVLRDLRPLAAELVAAEVPVIVFISPAGTQAGAPGAFLASAAHISAMAPQTSFGSAYPLVQLDAALSRSSSALVADSVADQLRDWNRARNRNLAWIEQAVQQGAILTNQQAIALTPPAVDLVAADQQQLFTLLDGRVIVLANGASVQLATMAQQPTRISPSFTESIWQLLAEPNTVFALLVLGALAIYLEFAAPGTSFFAGVGVILLITAGIGLLALPVQWWAIGLIVLGLLLIGLEFAVTSHGGLTIAGLVLLTAGGLTMVDPLQAPGAGVALWAVLSIVIGLGGILLLGFMLALQVRKQPTSTGSESMIGRLAEVRQRLDPQGMVFVEGALWQAVSEDGAVEIGDWVRVTAVHRLRLLVKPVDTDKVTS
jgi:membrane-bound serine protease (ClpP class)